MSQSFPKVKLIAVGKVKKSWLKEGIQIYQQRLPELEILEIKDSGKVSEAKKLQSLLKTHDTLIVLSEDGRSMDSVKFSHWLSTKATGTLVFFIGGPEGVDPILKRRATQILSLSAMTFPHEIARLLLVEQLYRVKTILQNGSYHK